MPLRCFKDFSLIFEREFSSIIYYFATFLKVIINSIHCAQWADRKINSQNINKGSNPFWDLKNCNYYIIVRAEEKKVIIIQWLYIVSIPLENEFYFSKNSSIYAPLKCFLILTLLLGPRKQFFPSEEEIRYKIFTFREQKNWKLPYFHQIPQFSWFPCSIFCCYNSFKTSNKKRKNSVGKSESIPL